jgi:hypothetical protein
MRRSSTPHRAACSCAIRPTSPHVLILGITVAGLAWSSTACLSRTSRSPGALLSHGPRPTQPSSWTQPPRLRSRTQHAHNRRRSLPSRTRRSHRRCMLLYGIHPAWSRSLHLTQSRPTARARRFAAVSCRRIAVSSLLSPYRSPFFFSDPSAQLWILSAGVQRAHIIVDPAPGRASRRDLRVPSDHTKAAPRAATAPRPALDRAATPLEPSRSFPASLTNPCRG